MDNMQQQIDQLQRRIENLEGKERSAVYDPASNTVTEATVDELSIRGCKVTPKPSEECIVTELEPHQTKTMKMYGEVEAYLKRPGGIIEQLETAQRETEERLRSLQDDVQSISMRLDHLG